MYETGWQCWIKADQLVIQLGTDPVIHPGSRISLASINDIESSTSNAQGSTTIVDDITNQVLSEIMPWKFGVKYEYLVLLFSYHLGGGACV